MIIVTYLNKLDNIIYRVNNINIMLTYYYKGVIILNTKRGSIIMSRIFRADYFCDALKSTRGNLSQTDFATSLETNRSTLSLLENGKQLPTVELLSSVANRANIDLNDFFIDQEEDGLFYMMGQLNPKDAEMIKGLKEVIAIKEKYRALEKRCNKQ